LPSKRSGTIGDAWRADGEQHEIAIERDVRALEAHAAAIVLALRDRDAVRRALDRHVAPEVEQEVELEAVVDVADLRRDAVRVRHAVRRVLGAVARAVALRRAGDVARRDQRRDHEPQRALVAREALHVDDLDDRLLAREEIAHVRREDVLALLLEQRRAVALRERVVVRLERLLALLHLALEAPALALHREAGEHAVARHRERVHGLDRLRLGVAVLLADHDARLRAVDLARERDADEGHGRAGGGAEAGRHRGSRRFEHGGHSWLAGGVGPVLRLDLSGDAASLEARVGADEELDAGDELDAPPRLLHHGRRGLVAAWGAAVRMRAVRLHGRQGDGESHLAAREPIELRAGRAVEARLDLVEGQVRLLQALDGPQAGEVLLAVRRVSAAELGRREQAALHVVADRARADARLPGEVLELVVAHELQGAS
jgi:hypothetical protein